MQADGTTRNGQAAARSGASQARPGDGGRIAENIVHFARLLRASGLSVGPKQTIEAVRAVMAAGVDSPTRLYWTLHAVFVRCYADREIFSQAFAIFWKDPEFLQQMMSLMIPLTRAPATDQKDKGASRRLNEALSKSKQQTEQPAERERIEVDARLIWSDEQVDRTKDFEQMSAEELRRAKSAIAQMRLPLEEIRTRRFEPARDGARIDLRRMLREAGGKGSDYLLLRRRRLRWRRPPVVVLCDISGSMESYARVFLHFLYMLTNDRDRVHTFVFGTRLTNITRLLRNRDPDLAISAVGQDVTDWSGGTRLGSCLEAFNRQWARRVLGQNALVLLFTDGLDRESGDRLELASRRLAASCRRLVWVNPLLRFDGYEPLARGAATLDKYTSETRPCHNLNSLADLISALQASGGQTRTYKRPQQHGADGLAVGRR